MKEISITKQHAQRFLLSRSFLIKKAKTIIEVLEKLSCIQVDPLRVIARSHELALWNRVEEFTTADLTKALYSDRTVFEYWLQLYSLIPSRNFSFVSARMTESDSWQESYAKEHKKEIAAVLALLQTQECISSKDVGENSGSALFSWKGGTSKTAILQYLWDRGIVVVHHREKNLKLYALTESVFSKKTLQSVSFEDSVAFYLRSSFDYIGLVRQSFPGTRVSSRLRPFIRQLFQEWKANGTIFPLHIEGVTTQYFIHKDHISELLSSSQNFHSGVTLLSPLDPIVIDRRQLQDIFDFSYLWEAYVPATKRKFGHYGMPLLYNGTFVGQVLLKKDTSEIYIDKLESINTTKKFQIELEKELRRLSTFS
jgi:uncharacterized protein YcaQ